MDKQRTSNILSSVQMSPRDRKDFIEELSKLGQGGAGGGTNEGGGEVSTEHPVRIIELTQENMGTFSMPYEEYINTIIKFRLNLSNTGTFLDNIPQNVFFEKIGSADYQIDWPHYKTGDVYVLNYKNAYNKFTLGLYITTSEDGILVENVSLGSMSFDDTYFNEICLNTRYANFNLNTISNVENDYSERALLITEKGNIIGTYYNGTFTGFANGKIQVYDINLNTGEITLQQSVNPELIGTVAKLEVGDADDICQRNLELINMAITQAGANHFDVDIDYGVGSATFTQGLADDAIAGTATIIVATGYVTKYNLYGNGKVEKVGNDIDLFALEARIAALEGA